MTDKARAEQLGDKILRLMAEKEALEYVFMELRIPNADRSGHLREPPYQMMAERISKEAGFVQVVARRKELLANALEAVTDNDALTRLYDAFFKSDSRA